MSIEISESEMLYRYADGLSKASSAAKQLSQPMNPDQPQALADFLHGLKVAAGSAHQLGVYRENFSLLDVRDILENVIDQVQEMTATAVSGNPLWARIEEFLKGMSDKGTKMADSKPISRQDVLSELNYRQKNPKTIH